MAIVTLTTDSGQQDHYVAAIKARIIAVNPGINIIDISHQVPSCDLTQAAFILKSVFRDFPKGTVHLTGVNAVGGRKDMPVALQVEDHFFVGADNGLFGLLSEKAHQNLVALHVTDRPGSFPERDIYAPAAAKLASGADIATMGNRLPSFKKLIDRQVKATHKQIAGRIVRVDHFGNLITNIPREAFEHLSQDKSYTVQFGGEKFRHLNAQYNQVDEGECFLVFNSLGLLEIGIYKGNASELLGMGYDGLVTIMFDE